MPPIFDIPAKAWSYDADLGDAVSAAAYDAVYDRTKADGTFEPDYFQTIRVFRGEADPDLVRIRPTTDGITDDLIVGVVDRNAGRREGGAVRGRLSGRDSIALALDRYPVAPFTLDGMRVAADGTLSFRDTFRGAVRRIASEAGLVAVFDCGDYKLGRSLPVTTDRTFGEYLQDLLAPWRFSEKHRIDVWAEGTILRVARRGLNARGTVQVRAERLHLAEEFEKTALPEVDGVRVEGAGYEVEEPDLPDAPAPLPGLPWTTAYSLATGPYVVTLTVRDPQTGANVQTIYIEDGTEWFDRNGRMTHSFRRRTYQLVAGRPTTRVESWEKSVEFYEDSTKPYDGAPRSEADTFRVLQVWALPGGGVSAGEEVIRERRTEWRYYEDNGDVLREDVYEAERDEQATLPLPVKTDRTSLYRYRRSGGRILRDYETVEVDRASGAVNRTFGTTDQGAFRGEAGQQRGAAARPGRRMSQRLVAAGPEPTSGKFRVERSELLGDQDACQQIRQDLADEHASIRIRAVFSMEPDLRVRVGKTLEVLDAPPWWPATSFLVVHVAAAHDGAEAGAMRVEGLAWAAAPP